MPTVNSNTVNLTLTSTWKCTWADDDHNSTYVSTPSSTDTQSASFSASVPAGATITGRILKTTWSNTGTVQTAQVNGSALGASVDSRAVSSMVHNYTWRASAAAMYNQGSYSRYMYVSAYIEVTYTEPESGLSLSTQHINAGQSLTAYIAPTNSAYWHRLRIQFGSASYSVDIAAGTKSIAYTIPMDWLEQIPSAAYGWGTVFLDTYNGSTLVGTKSLTLYIYAPASVVPTITGLTATLVSNGVDASITRYVQNYSKCLLEITGAAGAYGSTIVGYSITGGGISGSAATGTFGPFNMSGDVIFTAKVTDGRGRTATRQVAIDVMPYTTPAFSSPEAWRSNYDGVKNQKGTYVRLKSGVQYSSLDGQNVVTLKGRVYLKGGAAPAWETMTPDTELILGGGTLLSTRTYIAQIQVSDLLESRITEFIIPTKKTGLSIMAGLSGAAIGKSAETPEILDVAWPIVAPNFYPVGSIYMSVNSTSPATLFGGTWASMAHGRVLVGIDPNDDVFDVVGKQGGEKTHALQPSEGPAHNHIQMLYVDNASSTTVPGGNSRISSSAYIWSATDVPDKNLGNFGATSSSGSGAAHNNLQPYEVVYMWKRTA